MRPRRPPAWLIDLALVVTALLDTWVNVQGEAWPVLACALLGAVALALRRRLPLVAFVLTLPSVLVTDAVFAALVALYTLASLSRRRTLLGACAVAFTACNVTAWPWSSPQFAGLSGTFALITVSYHLAEAAAPVFLGQLAQARRELSLRLAEISAVREHEQLLITQTVLAKERAQLAREMHDVVSHQVSLIAVQAGALQMISRDAEVRDAASAIRRLSVHTLDELRQMVSVLRASGSRPTELTPQPSLADLRRLVDDSGIEAELNTDLPDGLPPPLQRAVYRTVQEALTNVRKHAPGARTTIRIHHKDGTVQATVTNTTPTSLPLPLPSSRHGLVGLRQRAELLGGTIACGPTADGGYELRLALPVDGPA
ncbi:sensor histidine kinase [Streptomyces sp. NPDC003247]|uniref:sensor histidine kinase n=1 Tax=Streptomyces sp. NPDC003247 TaxID=3364677 RepID=UPI0036C0A568